MRRLLSIVLVCCCVPLTLRAQDTLPDPVKAFFNGQLFSATTDSGKEVAVEFNSRADENFAIQWERPDGKSPGSASCVTDPDDPEKRVEYEVIFSSKESGSKVIAVFATGRILYEIPNDYETAVGHLFRSTDGDLWHYKLFATTKPGLILANNASVGLPPMLIQIPPTTHSRAVFKTPGDAWTRLYFGSTGEELLAAYRPDFESLPDEMLAPREPNDQQQRRAYDLYSMVVEMLGPESPLATREFCAVLKKGSTKLNRRFGEPGPFQTLIWMGFLQDVHESAADPEKHPLTSDDFFRSWNLSQKFVAKPGAGAFEKQALAALPSFPASAFRVRRDPGADSEPVSEAERFLLNAREMDTSADASGAYAAMKMLLSGKMPDMNESLAEAVVRCKDARLRVDSEESLREDLVLATPGWEKGDEHPTRSARINARERMGHRLLLALLADARSTSSEKARESIKDYLAHPEYFSELSIERSVTAAFEFNTMDPAEKDFWYGCKTIPRDPEAFLRVVEASRTFSGIKDPSKLLIRLACALGSAADPAGTLQQYEAETKQSCIQDLITADSDLKPTETKKTPDRALASIFRFVKLTGAPEMPRYLAPLVFERTMILHFAARMQASGKYSEIMGEGWKKPILEQLEEHGQKAYQDKHYALAAGLYLYGHTIEHPEMKYLPRVTVSEMAASTERSFLAEARRCALMAARPSAWTPLSPNSVETPLITHVFNTDPVLCRAPFTSILGIVAGDPATFGPSLSKFVASGTAKLYSVTGSPPTWTEGDNLPAATWNSIETAAVRKARESVAETQKVIAEKEKSYQFMRHFYGLDEEPPYTGGSTASVDASGLAGAEATLAAAKERYAQDLNRGLYVGADPNRYDRVITREMTSVERRSAETLIDGLEKQAEFERRFYQKQMDEARAEENARNEAIKERNEYERRVDAPGHRKEMVELYDLLGYKQRRLTQVSRASNFGSDPWMNLKQLSRANGVRESSRKGVGQKVKKVIEGHEQEEQTVLEYIWLNWLFGYPRTDSEEEGRMTFYGTEEAKNNATNEKVERPLSAMADVLLEAVGGPEGMSWKTGLAVALWPDLHANFDWVTSQTSAILDDAWLRYSSEPYELRSCVYDVVRALDKRLQEADSAAALKPWIQRFTKVAAADDISTVLLWENEPALREIVKAAMQP